MRQVNYEDARWKLIFLSAVFVAYILYSAWATKFSQKIRFNHIVVCGTILEIKEGWHQGRDIEFEFVLNNKKHTYTTICPDETYKNYYNLKNNILVVIEKGNPDNNAILDESDDYKRYGITMEDTLNIKCQYVPVISY